MSSGKVGDADTRFCEREVSTSDELYVAAQRKLPPARKSNAEGSAPPNFRLQHNGSRSPSGA